MNDDVPGYVLYPCPLRVEEIVQQLHEEGFTKWRADGHGALLPGCASVQWRPSLQLFVCSGALAIGCVGIGPTPAVAVQAYRARLRRDAARMLADAEEL